MRLGLVFVLLLMGSVSAVSICIDNVAPGAPGNLSVSGSVGSILVSWSAVVDEPACSGIDYYNVSRDGVWIGQTDNLIFVDNVSLGEGSYSYTVYAVDLAGGNAGASVINDIKINHGGGSSGGGSSSSYVCEVNWSCGEWSECVGGEMRRICEDLNECGTPYLKPVDYQECGVSFGGDNMTLESVVEEPDVGSVDGFFSTITGAVIGGGTGSVVAAGVLLLLSVLGLITIRRRRSS